MDNTTQLSSYADMTDEELYGFYYGSKSVIDEREKHEPSTKNYVEITTEIANRYFNLIRLKVVDTSGS